MATHKINTVVTNYDVKNKSGKVGKAFFGKIVAAAAEGILAEFNITNSTKTSFVAAVPDVPRNVTIDNTDTTATIVEGNITVTGLDINGNSVIEKFVITAGAGLDKTGSQIFKKITSIVLANFAPAELGGEGDETCKVGWGTKIGLPLVVGQRLTAVKEVLVGGSADPAPTVDYDKGSVIFNTAPNATGIYEVTYEFSEDF